MLLRNSALNPAVDTRTEYSPGASAGASKTPAALVVTLRSALVARFVVTTVAFATTAFDGSVTMPVISAVVVWAQAEQTNKDKQTRNSTCLNMEHSRKG